MSEKNESKQPIAAGSECSARLGEPLVPFDTHWEIVQACDKLRLERDMLKSALDDLHMHGTPVVDGWMSVPICEWEQAFKRIEWDA